MKFFKVLMYIAGISFIASLVVHLLAMLNFEPLFKMTFLYVLHLIVFIVWFPAIFLYFKRLLTNGLKIPFKVIYKGSSKPLLIALLIVFCYFIAAMVLTSLTIGKQPLDNSLFKLFPLAWMFAFALAFVYLDFEIRDSQSKSQSDKEADEE